MRIAYDDALTRALETGLAAAACASDETLEHAPLGALLGRVLAEDVHYPGALPPFAYASMDGYAIAGGAEPGAAYVVRGEARAGAPRASALGEGEAAAISTGAALPEGADTVVPWEDVTRGADGRVVLARAARTRQFVRAAGEDATAGALAVARGTRLEPRHVAALAAAERTGVRVSARPRVALLATGDELVAPGTLRGAGQIVDVNTPMVAALAAQAGADVRAERVADDHAALARALEEALASNALVVTIGGAAEGAHDHVSRVLEGLGAAWVFRGVAMKPGKPAALARVGGPIVLALPGNPGSAYVSFALLGAPLVRALAGDARARPSFVMAETTGALSALPDRLTVAYGALHEGADGARFVPCAPAPPGSIPGVAGAEALALVTAAARLAPGDRVRVVRVRDV